MPELPDNQIPKCPKPKPGKAPVVVRRVDNDLPQDPPPEVRGGVIITADGEEFEAPAFGPLAPQPSKAEEKDSEAE